MARVFGKTDRQYLSEVLKSKHLGWRTGGFVTRLDEAFAASTRIHFGDTSAPDSGASSIRRGIRAPTVLFTIRPGGRG
jgi:hypothetical protein